MNSNMGKQQIKIRIKFKMEIIQDIQIAKAYNLKIKIELEQMVMMNWKPQN